MTLHYNLTEEDYIDFNMMHFNNSPSMKRQRTLQLVCIPLLFVAIVVLYIVFTKPESLIAPILICIIGSLVWILAYPFFLKRDLRKNVQKLLKEGDAKKLVGEFTLTVDDMGIEEKSDRGSVKSTYDAIEKVVFDEKHVYVYNSTMSAFMIPHSAFETTGQEDELVSFIKEKAGL